MSLGEDAKVWSLSRLLEHLIFKGVLPNMIRCLGLDLSLEWYFGLFLVVF